jgi:hypothetical protein
MQVEFGSKLNFGHLCYYSIWNILAVECVLVDIVELNSKTCG